MSGLNLTQKIIASHLANGEITAGTEIALRVDQGLLQDTTGTMALLQLEEQRWDQRVEFPGGHRRAMHQHDGQAVGRAFATPMSEAVAETSVVPAGAPVWFGLIHRTEFTDTRRIAGLRLMNEIRPRNDFAHGEIVHLAVTIGMSG